MGTLGPTGTTDDVTTFANFKSWAGTGTFGINTALTNFGWTRTSDLNQINWATSPGVPPLAGNTYPISSVYPLSGTPGPSGTVQPVASASMSSNAFSTAYANEIVLVVGQSYTNLRTFTPGAGWTQDGGTSLNAQQIASAEHQIFTSLQTNIHATMTDSGADPYQMFALGLGTTGTAPVLVNFAGGGQQNDSFTTVSSVAQNITTGNTIVICIRWSASAVTDTAGNVYTKLPFIAGDLASNNDGAQFWYVFNATGNAANVVTATLTQPTTLSTNTYTYIASWQISGEPFSIDFTPSGYLNQVGAMWNAGGFQFAYSVNCRGSWISGTTYNLNDVVTSPATGASYCLTRAFDVTNVSVADGIATCTAANDLIAGDVVRFTIVSTAYWLLNQTFTVISATLTTFTINVSAVFGLQSTNQTDSAMCGIQRSGTIDPSNDPAWSPYHYEIWQSNDAASSSVTNVARSAGGLATFTCVNRFKAGFNVVVSGLTNVPQLNGTWCVSSATPTTFTVQTGGSAISSTSDNGTATYTFMPMCMKLEYYGNTAQYMIEPWIRLSFGIGGTDGVGNLVGNFIGSNNAQYSWTGDFIFCDLRPDNVGSSASGAQTSTIWQCAASGASPTGTNTVGNAGRFGVALWYSRNDTFVTNNGSIFWVVERSYTDAGYASDDYITYVVGCWGNAGVFSAQTLEVQQRSILKPNPTVSPINVSVVSNVLAISYTPALSNYQFAVGATVYANNFLSARFLNDQFLQVTVASLSLTSVASTTTTVDTLTAVLAAATFGQTAYAGTFSPTILTGTSVTITGFTNLPNNGTFTVISCSATSLVVNNPNGIKETTTALATYQQAIYTGAITNGASNFYTGLQINVTGFSGANNNGTFTCTASSATTLTLSNSAATAETHAATVTGNFLIASFTNANYEPSVDTGDLAISTSAATLTPIAGTGLVCMSDPRVACPWTSLSSLIVNGNVPLLPVFPMVGFVGNPMTIGASIKFGDQVAHDQIFPITVYGVGMHYNNLQGTSEVDPYLGFGGFNGGATSTTNGGVAPSPRTNGLLLRWD